MMNNILILLKPQLLGFLGINSTLHSKSRKKQIGLAALGIILLLSFAALEFFWCIICFAMGSASLEMGIPSLLPALIFGISSIFCLSTTLYKGNSILFAAQDFDILMPMPVSTTAIVASKIAMLYLTNLGFSLFTALPGIIIYNILSPQGLLFWVYAVVTLLLIPAIPITIGSALSVGAAYLASRFKYKNLVNTLLLIMLFCGCMYLSFSMSTATSEGNLTVEDVASFGVMAEGMLNRVYPLTSTYSKAIQGSLPHFALFSALSVGIFWLFCGFIGTRFTAIQSALGAVVTHSGVVRKEATGSSPLMALYKRDIKRFFSSPMYMLNSGVGGIMMVIGAGAIAFNPSFLAQITDVPQLQNMLAAALPLALGLVAATSNTTCISISLEGATLPLLKSLPVSHSAIFLSKGLVNLTIVVPCTLVSAAICGFALGLPPLSIMFMVIIPLLMGVFSAASGLVVNLLLPSLEWTNETNVIKRSAASFTGIMVSMLVGLGAFSLLFIVPIQFQNAALGWLSLALAIVNLGIIFFLKAKGGNMLLKL